MPLFSEPQQVTEYVNALLLEKQGELGLAFVGKDVRLIPEYPAAIITAGGKQKEVHATHTFNIGLEVIINVYHAKLTLSRATRMEEDLALVSAIENLLERGSMNFDEQVTFAYVSEVTPGTIVRGKGEQVIGSRMIVDILSQKRFPYGP